MLFLFKKKKLVVDAFTNNPSLPIGAPIEPAMKYIPDWWKATPKTVPKTTKDNITIDTPTIKSCYGIIKLYQEGHILPLWSDMIIESHGDSYLYHVTDDAKISGILRPIDEHPPEQYENPVVSIKDNWLHAKLSAPWFLSCSKDVKFLCTEPTWSSIENDYGIKTLPGVLDFKNQFSINVNMLIPRGVIRRMTFNFRTPVYHIICLDKDYDVEYKSQYVDESEWKRLNKIAGWRPFARNNAMKTCPFRGKI